MNDTRLHAVTAKEAKQLRKLAARRADALARFRARYRHNPESSRAMLGALHRLAVRFSGGTLDERTFPWELLVDRDLVQAMWSTVADDYSAATATRDASALRVMLQCCERAKILTYEQYRDAVDFEAKGGTHRPPPGTYLTTQQLGAVVHACENGAGNLVTGIRDAALITFMAGSGLRRMEVENVQLSDLNLAELRMWLGRTKGGRPRDAWLHPAAARSLERWLQVRGDEPGPLFVPLSRTGRPLHGRGPLSNHQIWKIVRTRGAQAGIPGLTPHDMRRFLISHLLPTTDITLVARIVGHARISTTAKYDRRPQEQLRRAVATIDLPGPGTTGRSSGNSGGTRAALSRGAVVDPAAIDEHVHSLGRALGGQAKLESLRFLKEQAVARISVSEPTGGEISAIELAAPTIEALHQRLETMITHVNSMDESQRKVHIGLLHSGVPVEELDQVASDLLR